MGRACARSESSWHVRYPLKRAVAALLIAVASSAVSAAATGASAELEVFTRPGCPRCAAADRFLEELQREQPGLRITRHDIERVPGTLRRLRELAARHGTRVLGVPAFLVNEKLLIGFLDDETTGKRIRSILTGSASAGTEDGEAACAPDAAAPCAGAESIEGVTLPFFGQVTTDSLGLPLFTVAIGLLDGFNPCAMWVLLFLLSLLVNVRSRWRMFVIAATFVGASGLVYFALMAAWLNLFLLVGLSPVVRVVLGSVAGAIGVLNVKDFFAFGRGVSLAIPAAAKPWLYAQARRVLAAENLAGGVAGVVALALLANTVELLCTAGLPALYTHVLTQRQLSGCVYYGYLALYNAAYILDDSVMVIIAVITLNRYKLQERGGRWLKLVSGMVMLALGVALVAAPEWLTFGAG